MAKQLQLRRGTTVQHSTFTGAVGEITIDTDKDVVVVHDGSTAGGKAMIKETDTAYTIATVNDFSTVPSGITTVIVKDKDRGGVFNRITSTTANNGTIFSGTGYSWERQYSGAVNVKWFGAKGDGLGTTPNDDGIDISSVAWNTWDNTDFKENLAWSPYGTSGTFNPTRAKPFANDDTWDYIGISLALWKDKTTYIPQGTYLINLSSLVAKGTYNGLLIMRGHEQTIYGDGLYDTIITTKEDASFFNTNNVNSLNYYKLFTMYRTGGVPTVIKDLQFAGPGSYNTTSKNLTLIRQQNINGVVLNNLWLTSCDYGIYADNYSGDNTISLTTAEYCFNAVMYIDSSSDYRVDFCNFWASAAISGQRGIVADGYISVTNTKLVNFYASPCTANKGIFSNNTVDLINNGVISFTNSAVFNNNIIRGETNSALVNIQKESSITGNYFYQTSQHPCIAIGSGLSDTATNIEITGNTFIKTNDTVASQNYAIVAIVSGSNYTEAATPSCLIVGNTFQGRALSTISDATISRNTFNGVLQNEKFTIASFSDRILVGNPTDNGVDKIQVNGTIACNGFKSDYSATVNANFTTATTIIPTGTLSSWATYIVSFTLITFPGNPYYITGSVLITTCPTNGSYVGVEVPVVISTHNSGGFLAWISPFGVSGNVSSGYKLRVTSGGATNTSVDCEVLVKKIF